MRNPYLLVALERLPISMERIIELVPPERYDHKTDPDRFSFREGIAHLADWEPIMLSRLQKAKYEPGGIIQAFDEGQLALDHDYASWDPKESVQLLIERRKPTLAFLKNEAPGHWNNTATHTERGELSLSDLAAIHMAHDVYHLEHLTQFLSDPLSSGGEG